MATTPYFITESQFIGEIQLDFGTFNKFDDFTSQVERVTLIELLGFQLFRALIDDLDASNVPQTQKYIDLVDGIEAGYVGSDGKYHEFVGIKAMLPYFFYPKYVKDVQSHNTEVGDIQIDVTNSAKDVYDRNDRIFNSYNKGVLYYYQVVEYIEYINSVTPDTYEGFDYKVKEMKNVWDI